MAYTKHEWVTGEIITAANLNHIEDGIASKLDANAVVNSQEADTPGTALDAMQGNPDVPGSLAAQIKEAGESSKAIVLTQAQYDALTEEEKDSDNVYYISDAPFESSNVVPLTRAEYDALTEATKNDGRFYYITDEEEIAKSLVVQTNVNSTETVPSSAVVYGLKSDTDSQISSMNSRLDGIYSANVAHDGKTKLKIKADIPSNSGYNRQGFFLFSIAGGHPWSAMMRISTENFNPATEYTNVIGTTMTNGSASSEDGYVVGTFTVGGRYDRSVILSDRPFTVTAVD